VVDIPFLNYLLGKPLAWTGWGPSQDRHQRFFRRGWVETTSDIHAFIRMREGARVLRLASDDGLALVHFNYTDIAHFIEKLNRYTTIEAVGRAGSRRRVRRVRVIAATIREFTDRFLRHKGYRDGWRGFYLAGLMAFYRFAVYAKEQELTSIGTREDVERLYEAEAERWLSDQ
jgi:(heptosyl)LPS beta-1,4-glucosyltransferase